MRICDVMHLMLDDVLTQVDIEQALRMYRWCQDRPEPISYSYLVPEDLQPWPYGHILPPYGTWRLDPVMGDFDVLVQIDPWEVEPKEGEHEYARRLNSSTAYRQWFVEGKIPPPITVIRHVNGSLISLNRRRVLAARDTNTALIPAWFSETDTVTGRPRWEARRLGSAWQEQARHTGWDAVLA